MFKPAAAIPIVSSSINNMKQSTPTTTPETIFKSKAKLASLRLFQQERDRWLTLLEKIAPNTSQPEQMSTLLEWIEQEIAATKQLTPKPYQTSAPPTPSQPQPEQLEQVVTKAAEQAWEKISTLADVLTQLVVQFEQHTAPNVRTKPKAHAKHLSEFKSKAKTAEPTPVASQKQESPSHRATSNAQSKVNQAIDQIIQYNSTPNLPHDKKWAITFSGLKAATKCYQGVIKRVLEQRQPEIDQHHQVHGLGTYHNSIHRRTGTSITDIVHLDS